MILDGKKVAQDVYADLAPHFKNLGKTARLGILVVGVDPVIEQFVGIKTRAAKALGVETVRVDLPAVSTTEEAMRAVRDLAQKTDAIIVQLPMPKSVDTNAVLSEIPHSKDVDAINPEHGGSVEAPVALAVVELLTRGGVEIKAKRVVVIGAGRLVGAPTAKLLRDLGADVGMLTLEQGSIEDLKDADIIVCGAGKPGLVQPAHVKEGVAIIDAGASESEGVIKGDADPACAEKAAVFTTVPGGVGPVAVAMIFKNLLHLIERR